MKLAIFIFICSTLNSCKTKSFILTDKKLKAGQIYTTQNVYYSLGSDSLLVEICRPTLDSIYNFIQSYPNIKFEVGVHTDFRGDDEKNLILSQNRANSLKNYLINQGIFKNNLKSKGYGETKPLRSRKVQDKMGNHIKNVNRRVTIKVL